MDKVECPFFQRLSEVRSSLWRRREDIRSCMGILYGYQQHPDNLRQKGLLPRLKNDRSIFYLVSCSASNFAGSAYLRGIERCDQAIAHKPLPEVVL